MLILIRMLAMSIGILSFSIGAVGPSPAQGQTQKKGSWYVEIDDQEQPSLGYRQGNKIIFYVGVGRAVGLWVAFPGPPQPDRRATITIKTSSRTWTVKGELVNDHGFKRDDERATYFLQWDMGLSRPKPEFNNLTRLYNKFIDTLLDSKRIVIVTQAGAITLPGIDVKGARKQMHI